ncbi:MAG TPA: TVP38/TMEM64 family protein [Micromonosporaceae bacterium]|nr:TVP38/TMEM64 family protein [Micromonosporaceae bacterium]
MPSPPILHETMTSAPAVQTAGDSMSGSETAAASPLCARVTRGAVIRFGMLIALILGLGALALTAGPDRHTLIGAAQSSGGFAPFVAVLGSALLAAAILPRTLLALVSGLMFGWVSGALYVIAGVTLGATLAFFIGRLLGRDFVERRLRGRLRHIEQAVASRGALAVLISRMIPLVPFGISNYAFGTTSVSRRSFFLGTLLGVAPASIAYAALGAATAHGDATGMTIAGATVAALGLIGSIGSYLVWRRRPRRTT